MSPKPKPLPQSIEAERAILGSLILNGELVDEVRRKLEPEAFIRPDHAALYRLLLSMASKYEAIDAVTVPERVARSGRDEQFGGLAYVMQLPDAVPSTAAIRHYVAVVNRAAAARRAIEVLDEVRERIANGYDPAEHIGPAADELMRLADEREEQPEIHTLRDSKQAVLNRMDSGVPDRVTFFDPAVQSAIRRMMPGGLTAIGATPGTGKTAMAMQLVAHNDANGATCGVIPLEMGHEGVSMRAMSTTSGVRLDVMVDRLAMGGKYDVDGDTWDRLLRDVEQTSDRVFICDSPARDLAQLCSLARQMQKRCIARNNRGLDLLVVDYAQMITVARIEALHERISAIAYGLQALGKELGAHVVLTSQLTREGELAEAKGEPLNRYMLFGGGGMNNAADNTLLLCRRQDGTRLLYLGKARWGTSGGPPREYVFQGEHQRFVAPEDLGVSTMLDKAEADEGGAWLVASLGADLDAATRPKRDERPANVLEFRRGGGADFDDDTF